MLILDEAVNQFSGINRVLVPFMACGDLSGFDSDRTYPLELSSLSDDFKDWKYSFKEVTQPPTEPAYKKACALKRSDKLEKCDDLKSPGKNDPHISKKKNDELFYTNDLDEDILESLNNFFIDK